MQSVDLAGPGPRPARRYFYARAGKRALDLTLGIIALPVLLIPIVILWAIARRDGGPGFYGHLRMGRAGRPFLCWKIRTMHMDAERSLRHLLASDPAAAAEWRTTRKLRNDPRLTPLGRRLRRTGLDELPQILNVLGGDMSLVGPRPITSEELECYGESREAYLSLRPGVTGLWQVFGRGAEGIAARVQFDVAYSRGCTLATDLVLILSTFILLVQSTSR